MSARLKTPRFGIDYAEPWSVQHVRDYGASFVMRYVSRYTPKALSKSEYAALKDAGIDVAIVFEDATTNARLGVGQGEADATYALNYCRDLGMPDGRPIYFAVDFDPAGDPAQTDGYFNGVAAVLGSHHSGPYGGIEVVTRQLDRGFGYAWQTAAWSGGQVDARAKVYQYEFFASVDYDHAYYEDFGQWGYVAPAPDPYWFFLHTPTKIGHRKYTEAVVAREFDRSSHSTKEKLRPTLKLLRDRIWRVAHEDNVGAWGMNVNWTTSHRGKRWQAFNKRMNEVK